MYPSSSSGRPALPKTAVSTHTHTHTHAASVCSAFPLFQAIICFFMLRETFCPWESLCSARVHFECSDPFLAYNCFCLPALSMATTSLSCSRESSVTWPPCLTCKCCTCIQLLRPPVKMSSRIFTIGPFSVSVDQEWGTFSLLRSLKAGWDWANKPKGSNNYNLVKKQNIYFCKFVCNGMEYQHLCTDNRGSTFYLVYLFLKVEITLKGAKLT